jgi:hypothetical protein
MLLSFRARFFKYLQARHIRQEALAGVNNCEHRIAAIFGIPCPFDPANNAEHQRLLEDFNTDSEIEEARADLEAQQKKITFFSRPAVLRGLAVLVVLGETLSSVQVFAACGEEMPERLIFGLCLTAAVFIATAMTVKHSIATKEVSK